MKADKHGIKALCVCGCENQDHSSAGSCTKCPLCLSFRVKTKKAQPYADEQLEDEDESDSAALRPGEGR
jgi:hypothetical protein